MYPNKHTPNMKENKGKKSRREFVVNRSMPKEIIRKQIVRLLMQTQIYKKLLHSSSLGYPFHAQRMCNMNEKLSVVF